MLKERFSEQQQATSSDEEIFGVSCAEGDDECTLCNDDDDECSDSIDNNSNSNTLP